MKKRKGGARRERLLGSPCGNWTSPSLMPYDLCVGNCFINWTVTVTIPKVDSCAQRNIQIQMFLKIIYRNRLGTLFTAMRKLVRAGH